MSIAAYVRVSSASQGVEMQRDAILRAAQARGEEIAGWYVDRMSGAKMARPELTRLRVDVRKGEMRKVYVYRLDRLTRSGIRDTLDLVEELRQNGCDVITLADGFDLNGPAAEVVLAVLAWAAKVERLAIGERIASARARVEAEGRSWGRPRRLDDDARQRVKQMSKTGSSVRDIATALRIPHSTVQRALKSPSQKPTPGGWGGPRMKKAKP